MIRLTIGNQRGGVGKTTTAVTLARLWAERGLRTLLVDADPQGSIGSILKVKPEPKPPKKRATKLPKQAVKAQPMLSKK